MNILDDKGVHGYILERHFGTGNGYTAHTAALAKRSRLTLGQRDLEALRMVQSTRPLKQGQCSMPIWLALYDGH